MALTCRSGTRINSQGRAWPAFPKRHLRVVSAHEHAIRHCVQIEWQRRQVKKAVSSGLDHDSGNHDDAGPGRGARTLAQELAERLGIEVEEAQQLVDAESEGLTLHTGESPDHRYPFTDHASPALASKSIAMHGLRQLTLEPWIQEDLFHGANAPAFWRQPSAGSAGVRSERCSPAHSRK